jgi:ferritin-like metal-binding protein YciE
MSAPKSLKDVYADELKDLWFANDQMTRAVTKMAEKVRDPKLKKMFEKSLTGINTHSDALKALLQDMGKDVEKEHCKGMEGLVAEALKHSIKEAPKEEELQEVVMIAQYQRMSHYGITGFGTAAAYAKALGMKEHAAKLKSITSDIYQADEYATTLAEKSAQFATKEEHKPA